MFNAFSGVFCAVQGLMFPFSTAKPYFSARSNDHFASHSVVALFWTETQI